jgi:hypothetical protein
MVRSNDATASIRGARRAGADVVGGILVRGAVERGMVDGRAERPVGGAAGVRSAREVELVAQRAAVPGAEGQREADARDDGRDPDGRTHDRALEAGGAQPDDRGKRGRIRDDDRRGAAVRDPHGAAGGRLRARVAELHTRGHTNAKHRHVGPRGG